jgi:two-component system, chemotaxis family, response regulator Rcp1
MSSQAKVERQFEVVLTEDNQGDVFLVREALQLHGVRAHLTVHRDGEQMDQLINQIETGKAPCPDLFLLDLNLPKRNGEALLARMRQSPLCAHVPIIIVTSSDSPNDRETMARLGANGYFRKPSDFDEFMKLGGTVKNMLDRGLPPV